jgi:hypothetical protein
MKNPFRNPIHRRQYDRMVAAFKSKDRFLFHGDQPYTGSSFAANFWAGYHGVDSGLFRPSDRAYRMSSSYIFYRAGQDCAAGGSK